MNDAIQDAINGLAGHSALLDDPLLKNLRKETAFNEVLTAASNCQALLKQGRQ